MNNDAETVEAYIHSLPEWKAKKLSEFRVLIHQVSSDVSEEIKWKVPAFIHKSKITFTMSAFKKHVKYNFIANGAQLEDPDGLFNNGLESAKSRSIDLTEDQTVDTKALKRLIEQALSR